MAYRNGVKLSVSERSRRPSNIAVDGMKATRSLLRMHEIRASLPARSAPPENTMQARLRSHSAIAANRRYLRSRRLERAGTVATCSLRYAARCLGRKSRSRETALRRPQNRGTADHCQQRRLSLVDRRAVGILAISARYHGATALAGPLRCDAFGRRCRFSAPSRGAGRQAHPAPAAAPSIRLKRSWLAFGVSKRKRKLVNNVRRRGTCGAARPLKHGHYVMPSLRPTRQNRCRLRSAMVSGVSEARSPIQPTPNQRLDGKCLRAI